MWLDSVLKVTLQLLMITFLVTIKQLVDRDK